MEKAQKIQDEIMGYLPGFDTPRLVCDVPLVGKRWVHQAVEYDRVRGISYWYKNYWTTIEYMAKDPTKNRFMYFDPIVELPEEGKIYWQEQRKMEKNERVRIELKTSVYEMLAPQ